MRVDQGQAAPDFTLPTLGGETITLSQFRGKFVVLFVYPKDNTPTCTDEAIQFSAMREQFAEAGAVVIGLSPDSVAKHEKFAEKHALTVPLLADEAREVIEGWGLWVEKMMYGRRTMGVERTTYLIGPEGDILRVWRKVRLKGHIEDVLSALREIA